MTLNRTVFLGLALLCVTFACTEALLDDETVDSNITQIYQDESVAESSTLMTTNVTTTDSLDMTTSPVADNQFDSESGSGSRSHLEDDQQEVLTSTDPSSLEPSTDSEELNMTNSANETQTDLFSNNVTTLNSTTTKEQQDIRILVVGRSGYGISSTIRELIGPLTKCQNEGTETFQNIYEYTISNIPGTNYRIKLVDIPGFVDGRTLEEESQLLATMKSYIENVGDPADFFLAVSGFDDSRYHGAHSSFVQFLKRIELFEQSFLSSFSEIKTNIVFLLTRLMSETKTNQRRPANKINTFRNVIRDYTQFPPPYQIVVGDNHAHSEHNAKIEGGYYLLPNEEHYPKNIWAAMINSSTFGESASLSKAQIRTVLTAIKDNREKEMKCEAELVHTGWDGYKADEEAFLYFLQQKNWTIEKNDVNLKIQETFDRLPLNTKVKATIQKMALQRYLQNANITNIQTDIPRTNADKATFFQKSPLTSSSYSASLLKDAFGLVMPEYIQPLTVGYGYDVLADELSLESPFKSDNNIDSSVGYRFPNFMKCEKYSIHETQKFQSYSQNISDYFTARLKHLKFAIHEDINDTKFSGKAKDGYNLEPEEGVEIATLTASKEVRTLKCVLAEKANWGELSEEFVKSIVDLSPVDLYSRSSVTDWEVFFGKYGTHIVIQGYGGGRLVGSIFGTNVRKAYESQSTMKETLDSILDFTPFSIPDLEKPSYQLFAGEIGNAAGKIRELYDLPEAERNQILDDWNESLNSNFEMLKHEFTLERISTVVKEKIDPKKAEMMDQAIELFLKGELKRQKKQRTNSTSSGTRRPQNGTRLSSPLSTPLPIQSQYTTWHQMEDSIYQDSIARMKQQREQDRKMEDARLANFRWMQKELQRKHKLQLEALQKLKEEREKREKEEEESCWFFCPEKDDKSNQDKSANETMPSRVENSFRRSNNNTENKYQINSTRPHSVNTGNISASGRNQHSLVGTPVVAQTHASCLTLDVVKQLFQDKQDSDDKWYEDKKSLWRHQNDALSAVESKRNVSLGVRQPENDMVSYIEEMKKEAERRHRSFMEELEKIVAEERAKKRENKQGVLNSWVINELPKIKLNETLSSVKTPEHSGD